MKIDDWIPAFAGMTEVGRTETFRISKDWIPAFAGMTSQKKRPH